MYYKNPHSQNDISNYFRFSLHSIVNDTQTHIHAPYIYDVPHRSHRHIDVHDDGDSISMILPHGSYIHHKLVFFILLLFFFKCNIDTK